MKSGNFPIDFGKISMTKRCIEKANGVNIGESYLPRKEIKSSMSGQRKLSLNQDWTCH